MKGVSRRDFIKISGAAGSAMLLGMNGRLAMAGSKSRVAFFATEDRVKGVETSIKTLAVNPAKGKNVVIKPNFNTADVTPGSTHNDTLTTLVEQLWSMGAKSITLGERSFPPTIEVMEQKGILPLLKKLDVKIINFDDLDEKDWVHFTPKDSHWENGFHVARPVMEAECLVATCCLKTHGFGGGISMSLKLNVGVVPTTRHGFDYMKELHGNRRNMKKMIAEINTAFAPDLIVMDGIDVFTDGGPAQGTKARGNVFLASTDRVALDAVGIAVLKSLGTKRSIMKKKIYENKQIARAAELGLGAATAADIELVPGDEASKEYASRIGAILAKG